MKKMTFRGRLVVLVGMAAFLWTLILVGTLTLVTYRNDQREISRGVENRITAIALSASTLIDGDTHQRLIEQGREDDPDYRRMAAQLRSIQKACSTEGGRISYIYTFWWDPAMPSKVKFGLDTGVGGNHSRINSVYEHHISQEVISALSTGEPTCEPISKDSYGIARTAYAPVFNKDGDAVAVVGVDLEAEWPPLVTGRQAALIITVLLISTFLGCIVAFILAPRLLNPLRRLAGVAEQVARGDLTADISGIVVHDEFSGLAVGIQTMVKNLRKLNGRITGGVTDLQAWGESLAGSAGVAGQGASDMVHMMSEVAAGADSVATSSGRIADEMTQIDSLAGRMVERTHVSRETAMIARDNAERGAVVVNQAVSQTVGAARTMNAAASEVEAFQRWSAEIGQTVGFIATLAEQTNMLAMNAQLEAVRAGQEGSGFMVVAAKICKLAGETAQFADRIQNLNREVGSRLSQVSMAMNSADRQATESAQLLDLARQSFNDITASTLVASNHLDEISTSMRELKDRTSRVRVETDSIAGVMEQSAASMQTINAGTEEEEALVREVEAAVKRLNDLADRLTDEVRQFKM